MSSDIILGEIVGVRFNIQTNAVGFVILLLNWYLDIVEEKKALKQNKQSKKHDTIPYK